MVVFYLSDMILILNTHVLYIQYIVILKYAIYNIFKLTSFSKAKERTINTRSIA